MKNYILRQATLLTRYDTAWKMIFIFFFLWFDSRTNESQADDEDECIIVKKLVENGTQPGKSKHKQKMNPQLWTAFFKELRVEIAHQHVYSDEKCNFVQSKSIRIPNGVYF